MPYPNAFIGGAPKSGTTSLHFWLVAHPEVGSSTIKETYFFDDKVHRLNSNANYINGDWEKYKKYFEHCEKEKIVLEATPVYLYAKNALEGVAGLPFLPKMIFVLREPAGRVYSQYRYHKYKLEYFRGSFSEFIHENKDRFSGKYVEESKYAEYLKAWMEVLGHENIRVVEFGRLQKEPEKVMKELSLFLGIRDSFYDEYDFKAMNRTVKIRNRIVHKVGLNVQKFMPFWLQEALIPLYQKVNTVEMDRGRSEDQQVLEKLRKFYTDDNRELKKLFPYLDLKSW